MVTKEEIKQVVDKLWETEEGEDVYFGEVKLVSEDVLQRYLSYNDIKLIFDVYYKRVDKAETEHAENVFEDLKEQMDS